MGSLYLRGVTWWAKFRDPRDGKIKRRSLETSDERQAGVILSVIERTLSAPVLPTGPMTLDAYATTWIAGRRARGVLTVDEDAARLRLHVLPTLGTRLLGDVTDAHLDELVARLQSTTVAARVGGPKGSKPLAPRSVRNVVDMLHQLLRDARDDGLIARAPKVRRGRLPTKRDADPLWRAGAVFARSEVEALISDERIPADRRTLYAVLFLAGLRFGEAAALRLRAYDREARPLGRLEVVASYSTARGETGPLKTARHGIDRREVPVHPTLASILADWLLSGLPRLLGQPATLDDLLIPSREGSERSVSHGLKRFHEDLARLGLRKRRQHDARRTFISLALADGARADVLRWVTHPPRGQFDAYTSLPWAARCEAVACLRVERRAGVVVPLQGRAAAGAGHNFGHKTDEGPET